MLFGEITAVYSKDHTKPISMFADSELINTLCWQNAQLLNVKAGGTYSKQ